MNDWTISAPGLDPAPARQIARQAHPPLTRPTARRRTYLLAGTAQPQLAACAHAALAAGHRVVLLPDTSDSTPPSRPGGTLLHVTGQAISASPAAGTDVRGGWDVAMFSSGSTTGAPRSYGFTTAQLDMVTSWYQTIYQVTSDSIIITALPVTYNFTFVAGVLLAARLGARLQLNPAGGRLLDDAARLARTADRVIVLANPVVLDQAAPTAAPPANVMVDSGGAPLSITAISDYRASGLDVREGYGLTETASLTHFDTEAAPASLGTVGTVVPGVHAAITITDGKPAVELSSPATGIPLDTAEAIPAVRLRTTDLGVIDGHGRLRLVGRADDDQISGLWPRDTLDALGPLLRRRCALVRHQQGHATIRLLTAVSPSTAAALRTRAAGLLGVQPRHVSITSHGTTPLLHSGKLTRHAAADDRLR
jgi:acyl-CoA synthetase (AMP-forming)/AMP-acid ligase II